MSPRYDPLHDPTSNTLALEDLSKFEQKDNSDEADAASYLLRPIIHETLVPDTQPGVIRAPLVQARPGNRLLLAGIFVMLVWPWVFLTIVWAREGIQMNNSIAKAAIDYPQTTNFFATLFGNIVSIIVSILFSKATIRFAQEWITNNNHVTVFDVSWISAFRHQNWPWGWDDRKYLRNRWFVVVLVGVCVSAFALVPSGTTSLITPVPFYRTVPLTGTELDFSSNAADCFDWFEVNKISNMCDWKTLNGLLYISCLGGAQLVDVLQSGRDNMRSLLSNKSQTLALGQLGANSPLHFSGPMRGVLPMGPNSLPGFDTLQPSLLSNARTKAVMLSYNYTLGLQGLSSHVSCIYDTQSPIKFYAVPNNTRLVAYNGTCDGLADVLTDVVDFVTLNVNNTLTFWTCKSVVTVEQEPTYYIYLRGRVNYATTIGNITCTVSPIQPAIFPVTYQSSTGIFSSKERTSTSKPANSFSVSIEQALTGLGSTVWAGQTVESNLVAESITSFGAQSFGLKPYTKDEQYLRLYEAMIQGILVDQVTYTRFLHSTITNPLPPSSCIRTVNGSLSAEVIGWFAKPVHIGFLMPMTILNLASLVIVIAMARAKGDCYGFDPSDPRPLLLAEPSLNETESSGWADGVKYRPREG